MTHAKACQLAVVGRCGADAQRAGVAGVMDSDGFLNGRGLCAVLVDRAGVEPVTGRQALAVGALRAYDRDVPAPGSTAPTARDEREWGADAPVFDRWLGH